MNSMVLFSKNCFLLGIGICVYAACATAQEVPQPNWEELNKSKPWEATEVWEPVPNKVTPGIYQAAPSDATILFGGSDLSQWRKPKNNYGVNMEQIEPMCKQLYTIDWSTRPEADWILRDGQLIVNQGKGGIETAEAYGDVQLHIEWLAPVDPLKESQQYSNSGIFFMGLYEIQILNNYDNKTYVNGQASSVYKQHKPLVNASRPPGEWQYYDIVFNAPHFDADGNVTKPAYITVFHNGVLTQNHVELEGPTCFIGKAHYTAHPDRLPLSLQDHGDAVRFRNIWIREL